MLYSKFFKYFLVFLLLFAVAFTAHAQSTYKDLLNIACNSLAECIERIVRFVRDLAFPVAVVFIIYSGFLFVTAQGSPDKITNAKNTLTWTLIGLVIVIGAWALSVAFVEFFQSL